MGRRGDTRISGSVECGGLRRVGGAASDCGRARGAVDGAKVDVWSRALADGSTVGNLTGSARGADYDRGLPAVVTILHGGGGRGGGGLGRGVVRLCAVHGRSFAIVLDAFCSGARVGPGWLLRRHSC